MKLFSKSKKGVDKVAESAKVAGEWIEVNESMSDFSRAYQKFITGTDKIFLRNGAKFDGLKGNTLLDAKGNYSNFINKKGEFYDWFSGKDELEQQAKRQLVAAEGLNIEWHFSDEASYNATRILFEQKGIEGIELVLSQMP